MIDNLLIVNKSTSKSIRMDMNKADFLLFEGGIDLGSVETKHNTFSYTSQIGEYITGTILGKRNISISGWIIGKSEQEIFSKKDTLSKTINPFNDLRIQFGEYGIDCRAETNVSFSKSYKENNDRMCKFLIKLLCPFPLFNKNSDISYTLVEERGAFRMPWVITDKTILSWVEASTLTDVVNEGPIPVGVRIVLTAKGVVNNPTIILVETQEKAKLNKVMTDGETIEISSQKERYVIGTINGVTENYLDYLDYDSTWLQLKPGENRIAIKTYNDSGIEDSSVNNLEVNIYYNPCLFNLKEE